MRSSLQSHRSIFRKFGRALALHVSVVAFTLAATAPAGAANNTGPAYGPTEKALGRTLADWLERWNSWAFAGTSEKNPLLAIEKCGAWVQPEPTRVFYLGAAGPGSFKTTCNVPSGVVIAVSPGGAGGWDSKGVTKNVTEPIAGFARLVRNPTLTVDGRAIDPARYLTETRVFKTKISATEFGPDLGNVTMKGKGWIIPLRPMTGGAHTVTISDELVRTDANGKAVLLNGKPVWDLSSVRFTLVVP